MGSPRHILFLTAEGAGTTWEHSDMWFTSVTLSTSLNIYNVENWLLVVEAQREFSTYLPSCILGEAANN